MSVHDLDPTVALRLFASAPVSRLVVSVSDVTDVFPITHTVVGDDVFFRTAPGSKLAGLAANASVLVEADEVGADSSWSVIVRGLARRIEERVELDAVEPLLRPPYAGGWKEIVVRVTPATISGRRVDHAPLDDAPALDAPD